MNLTIWLEYFTHALASQMQEIKIKGEAVIRSDILSREYHLSQRQANALQYIIENREISIKDFEALYPDVTRRTLQREIKKLLDLKLIQAAGATNQLSYRIVTS